MFQDIHFFISCVVLALASMGVLGLYVEDHGLKMWREAEELVQELGGSGRHVFAFQQYAFQ